MTRSLHWGLAVAAAVLPLVATGCATPACGPCGKAKATALTNTLACRLANYGKFENTAWKHLPTIDVKYVFMNVPKPDKVGATMKRFADSGLTAVVMRGDADLSKDSCVDQLAAQSAICKKMGVKFMFLSAKRRGAEKQAIYDRLRKAGDAVREHGVTIALETHPEFATNGDVALQTMKRIDHPNVRMNFDTGNIHYYNENTDSPTELAKIIEYVVTVEVKDHKGGLKVWDFPTLGQGNVDIPGVLRMLEKHGYTGPVTMELEGKKGVELNEAETKQYIADSARHIKSLGQFK